jgi:hypothetical protein
VPRKKKSYLRLNLAVNFSDTSSTARRAVPRKSPILRPFSTLPTPIPLSRKVTREIVGQKITKMFRNRIFPEL